ncbi:MAG: hypothetical protein ACXW1F_06985 [Halobacteriota archaeon]
MATNVANIQTYEPLDAGTSSALRINRRIENKEIPLFIRRCVIDATRWEVDGTRYDQWRAENGNRKIPAAEWREQVVIPHLQARFDGLELRDDDRLYGIRHDTAEEINERFYNPQQLRGAMLAKCPGQRWLFALGCCRRHRPQ